MDNLGNCYKLSIKLGYIRKKLYKTIISEQQKLRLAMSHAATTLPVTNPIITAVAKPRNKLTLIPLIFIIYFEVAGGPYGEEPVVKAAGPFFAILGFLIFPLI